MKKKVEKKSVLYPIGIVLIIAISVGLIVVYGSPFITKYVNRIEGEKEKIAVIAMQKECESMCSTYGLVESELSGPVLVSEEAGRNSSNYTFAWTSRNKKITLKVSVISSSGASTHAESQWQVFSAS